MEEVVGFILANEDQQRKSLVRESLKVYIACGNQFNRNLLNYTQMKFSDLVEE